MSPIHKIPAKGKLLVAEPFLGDPTFERSVILLIEHNSDGTFGFVLNKPLDIKTDILFENFPIKNATVYSGGPVQKDNLYFIHNKGDLIPESIKISDNIYWSGRMDLIKELSDMGLIKEGDLKFFLGYSGWSENQLNDEIEEDSWMVLETDVIDVFTEIDAKVWKDILTNLGGEYKLWANAPQNPLMN